MVPAQAGAGHPQAVVIGPGRVGRAIASFYSPPAPLVGRGAPLPPDATGVPAWVCTTNDGLDGMLRHTAVTPAQRQQLVFVQNGMLLPWLCAHALQHNSTQVLLYMSATEDGHVTDGGHTCVHGPWADHVSCVLSSNGVQCSIVEDWQAFQQRMLVKLLWSCIFWVMSAALGGLPVGAIAQQHAADVSELVSELLPLGQAYLQRAAGEDGAYAGGGGGQGGSSTGAQAADSTVRGSTDKAGRAASVAHGAALDELLSYSLAIAGAVPSLGMARREFAWRNGWFLGQQPGGMTPRHLQWLERAGCADLVLAAGRSSTPGTTV